MSKKYESYFRVGKIKDNIAELVDFNYSGTVYMNNGVLRHILKKHKSQLSKKNLYDPLGCIKMVIKQPDYIGVHPSKIGFSIEFVKDIHENHILVSIEIDNEEEYIYVSSMYPITDGKFESRIHSERFKNIRNYLKK
ncbi:MAG: PBECR2 nuclease fold domain-containing protein [Clostridium sp.]